LAFQFQGNVGANLDQLEMCLSLPSFASNAVFAISFLAINLLLSALPATAGETPEQYALRMGGFHKARGANNEACQYYMKAVSLAPSDYLAHRALAEGYAMLKKYPEAMSEVNKAISLNPGDPKLYVERGLYYMGLGKKGLAESDFKKAVVSPDCGHVVYKYLEDIYKGQGRLVDAIAICYLHIKREANEVTYREKAECMDLSNDREGARQALTKAISLAPLNYRNYEMRADSYLASGLAAQAVTDYSKALSLEPFFPSGIYQNRARAYEKLGKKDLAEKDRKSSQIKD
jgi:tetratricopeptide (TPR) repeat protein